MEVSNRLKLVINDLKAKGKISTQKEFGYKLGFETESGFSQVVNGKVPFSETLYSRIKSLYPEININWLLTGEGEMLKETGNISIGGDNNGVANTGKIAGDVIYNNETMSDNTKDINALFTNYNDNKGIEIDRLQALYATILSEKNEVIRELKEVIKDLREDKKQLTNIIDKNQNK